MTVYSIMRGRKGMDHNGIGSLKELGGVEGGENIITIHYIRKSISTDERMYLK